MAEGTNFPNHRDTQERRVDFVPKWGLPPSTDYLLGTAEVMFGDMDNRPSMDPCSHSQKNPSNQIN